MALRPDEVEAYRKWINDQFGQTNVSYDASGNALTPEQLMANPSLAAGSRYESTPFQFNGDFRSDNESLNYDLLGAAKYMGIDDAGLSQILGTYTPEEIATYRQGVDPTLIDMASQAFGKDYGVGQQGLHSRPQTAQDMPNAPAPDNVGDLWRYETDDFIDRSGRSPGGRGPSSMFGNPWLNAMAGDITGQVNQNLMENILPNIRGGFRGMGGAGGSRQGIAEGKAIGDSIRGLSGQLASLYGGAYENDANRSLQKYGIDTNADLGWGGLGLQNQGQWMNFGLGLGGLDNQRLNTMTGFWDAERDNDRNDLLAGGQLSTQALHNSWFPYMTASSIYGNVAGNNNTGSSNSSSGGGWTGGIGGGLTGWSLSNSLFPDYWK